LPLRTPIIVVPCQPGNSVILMHFSSKLYT
jgi:hypothetical protein